MNFDAVEVYFIGRGRWWRSVDGADYRQFERFASDEDHYRESSHSRKMMLFMPVSESRRVKGVFSLTAEDAGFAKHGEKCPSNLYVLMPSSSEDSVYLNDVRYNRIPDRGDLFFEVEHLESINVVEHVPFPIKEDSKSKDAETKSGINKPKLGKATRKLFTHLYVSDTKRFMEQAHALGDFRISLTEKDVKNLIETEDPESCPIEHYEQMFLVIAICNFQWDISKAKRPGRGNGNAANTNIEIYLTGDYPVKPIVKAETLAKWLKILDEKYRIR
ncbi:hypothetical protein [Methylotuvimicrobium alcaliphilum]|uniref:Uncharacterized protein n=1 Tax=Methylotuvimicrobium alcaliphilum (strain DSM 19304 / NCIMB 14124 / VKM B-2133 / 20Z) TaxID=1091494 RepID=G4T1F6_META2|nr:hypothetical protein [Methylotuvimicrobium alcaliphilum]CCE25701.1 protein of unknown function [Methylotuvimicrobium alcaliphilum 20Z]